MIHNKKHEQLYESDDTEVEVTIISKVSAGVWENIVDRGKLDQIG